MSGLSLQRCAGTSTGTVSLSGISEIKFVTISMPYASLYCYPELLKNNVLINLKRAYLMMLWVSRHYKHVKLKDNQWVMGQKHERKQSLPNLSLSQHIWRNWRKPWKISHCITVSELRFETSLISSCRVSYLTMKVSKGVYKIPKRLILKLFISLLLCKSKNPIQKILANAPINFTKGISQKMFHVSDVFAIWIWNLNFIPIINCIQRFNLAHMLIN